jgi:hypothetical protein
LSFFDRGTDAKVERARTRASSTASARTSHLSRLLAGNSRRNVAFLASLFALGGAAVAVAAPGGTTVADSPLNPNTPGLAQVGPVAKNGFPAWYKDKNNIRLEPCLDLGDPMCIMGALPTPDQPVTPDDVAGNFPDEFFYQSASSGIANVGANVGTPAKPRFGKALAVTSLEGAFGAGAPKAGDQMVFARLRLRVTAGLQGSTNYMFVHPYGERTIQTDANSDNLFVTEDIGLAPGNFTDALKGRIAPFLKWDSSVDPQAPTGYTGDPNIDHPITGGVNDYFAIIGPGVGANKLTDTTQDCAPHGVLAKANAVNNDPNTPAAKKIKGTGAGGALTEQDCIYTNLFSLMGKMAENAGVDVKSATFSRDTTGNTAVDVQAESDANQTIVVRDPSANRNTASRMFPTTKLTEDNGGRYYAHVKVNGTSFPAGSQVDVVNGTDGNPQDVKTVTPTDEVLNATATWDNTLDPNGHGVLTVAAQSSDQFAGDSVTLSVDDPEGGPTPTQLGANGQAQLTTLPSAPRSVTITSSKGGTLTIPVHSDVSKPATPAPLTAVIRGPVKAVATGASVKLFGTGSSGPIASYAWTGPFAIAADGSVDTTTPNNANGGAITGGADTDTATLTAPSAEGQYGYQLEVTDDNANKAATTAVLTVSAGGVAVPGAGDPLTPGTVRYTETQGRMVIDGTATVRNQNKIKIWFANHVPNDPANTPADATANVDPVDGSWVFDTGRDGMPTPPNSSCVSYISINGIPGVGHRGNLADLATPADEWDCLPIDGRKLTNPLPAPPDPPGGPVVDPPAPVAGAAAAAPRAIAGAVPLAGAAAPAVRAAARVAAPAIATTAALATTGVSVNVTVPAGATLLRVRVLTTANKALATTFKKVKAGKKVKVKVRSAKAARKLRGAKRFVIEVRAGTAKNRLGKATRKVIRIRA